MRMPNSKDMSQEQMKVYVSAPMEGSILVSGPPGTGKTVIAFLRAKSASEISKKVKVVMYTKVLRRYTENAARGAFDVNTLHSSLGKWWYSVCFSYTPMESGDTWQHDWPKMFLELAQKKEKKKLDVSASKKFEKRLHWGHMIIDEGQDFPSEMYSFFENIRNKFFQGAIEGEKPAITVFADENQRLQPEKNSTIGQIRDALGISRDDSKRNYILTKNYRNSRQVAELAAYFYVGLSTGKPELPDKSGETPKLVFVTSLESSIDYIVRYIKNHDNEEIGVIVQNNEMRRAIHKTLQSSLMNFGKIKLQTYSSYPSDNSPVENMKFDRPGTVTLLDKKSCKGLEFDSVFLPEIQQITVTPDEIDIFKMDMYVMIARARKSAYLMISNSGSGTPAIMDYLPDDSLLERQHV